MQLILRAVLELHSAALGAGLTGDSLDAGLGSVTRFLSGIRQLVTCLVAIRVNGTCVVCHGILSLKMT